MEKIMPTKEKPVTIEPLHDLICLCDPQFDCDMRSMILRPDNANKGRWIKATVHAVGPEVKTAVKVGDVVFIPEVKGEKWKNDGKWYLFYHAEELLAKEREDE
jgi:co-chaperonin GroES (HSP10)